MALAEAKSFYKAAENIGLTQSALTQAISKLEKELELQLFVRSKTGSILTEHGQRLHDHAKVIMAQVEAAETELKVSSRQVRTELRLGVVKSLSNDIVMEIFSDFKKQYPEQNFKVIKEWSDVLSSMLTEGEIDFAFLSDHFLSVEMPELHPEILFTDRVQVVVGEKHDLFESDTVSIGDLANYQWVAVSVSPDWPEYLARVFAAADRLPPEHLFKTNSTTLATQLIREGQAVGIVSKKLFQLACGVGDSFKYFDVPELRQTRRFIFCHRARMVLRPLHHDFIKQLKRVVKERIELSDQPE